MFLGFTLLGVAQFDEFAVSEQPFNNQHVFGSVWVSLGVSLWVYGELDATGSCPPPSALMGKENIAAIGFTVQGVPQFVKDAVA